MRNAILIIIITLSLTLLGCNTFEEKKAEGIIKKYYQALVDEDYEKAFEQLCLYDYNAITEDGHYMEGTILTLEEAKDFYFKKIKILKEQDYKLTGFEIVEVEYEDGHSFWHHINLEIEQEGQTFERKEVADIYEGKLVIGEMEDPNAKYRDGKMGTEIKGLIEKES